MATSSKRVPKRRRRRGVAGAAGLVSLTFLAAGLVGFFADPLHVPLAMLELLDQRASVIGMFVGIAGLVMAGVTLWTQLRESSSPSVPFRPDAEAIVGVAADQASRPVHLAPRPP
ncbi:hypothetical protein [Nonomuraea sp. NPDC002799]